MFPNGLLLKHYEKCSLTLVIGRTTLHWTSTFNRAVMRSFVQQLAIAATNDESARIRRNRRSQSQVTAAHEIWTSPQQSPRNTNSAAAFPPNRSCFANRPITSKLVSRIRTQRKSAYKYTRNSLFNSLWMQQSTKKHLTLKLSTRIKSNQAKQAAEETS